MCLAPSHVDGLSRFLREAAGNAPAYFLLYCLPRPEGRGKGGAC
jgi:hypothetical protein